MRSERFLSIPLSSEMQLISTSPAVSLTEGDCLTWLFKNNLFVTQKLVSMYLKPETKIFSTYTINAEFCIIFSAKELQGLIVH